MSQSHIDQLLSIEGMVIRCSPIIPEPRPEAEAEAEAEAGDSQALADEPHLAEKQAFHSSLIN